MSSEVVGAVNGLALLREVKSTLGINTPSEVEVTSRAASGRVVPIPTCAFRVIECKLSSIVKVKAKCFINNLMELDVL